MCAKNFISKQKSLSSLKAAHSDPHTLSRNNTPIHKLIVKTLKSQVVVAHTFKSNIRKKRQADL